MRHFMLCAFVLTAGSLTAADLPSVFTLPPHFRRSADSFVQFDTRTVDERNPAGGWRPRKLEGRIWGFALDEDPPAKPEVRMKDIETALRGGGWTIERNEGQLVARKTSGGQTFWFRTYPNTTQSMILEETAPPRTLSLTRPRAQVETIDDAHDFPYALPFPGGTLQKTIHDSRSVDVTPRGTQPPIILQPTAHKVYAIAKDVSPYEFVNVKRDALAKAGWTIARDGIGSDGLVVAHYAKDERDIWLYDREQGGMEDVIVADVGAEAAADALRRTLASEGHVALYGIYFDTDSAIPKPESEATLKNVLQLLQSDAALRLEIGGHTDDSGNADHNAKLSNDRAASVKSWLIAHGIGAARLESHGYGAAKPVADNHTAEGKAKNRRVELRKL